MTTVALEFSSDRRSVAVVRHGEVVSEIIFQGTVRTPVFQLVESALREAGVERSEVAAVVVGLGPGSYTGVRIAISVAQGWELASGVRTAGINSFEILAAVHGAVPALLAIDAQRDEFAVAEVANGRLRGPVRLISVSELRDRAAAGELVVGPDVSRVVENGVDLYPTAGMAARLMLKGHAYVPAERLTPIYLRETSFVKAPPTRDVAGLA